MGALLLFVGGAVGAFCRGALSDTQATWSRRTLVDVLMGGVMGLLTFTPLVLGPLQAVFALKDAETMDPYQRAALAAAVSFVVNWATTLAGWKLGWFARHGDGP